VEDPFDGPTPGDDVATVIKGTTGNDLLRGTSTAELILAGDGSDKIFGGSGDDIIAAGAGDDFRIEGGRGADTFRFTQNNGTNIIRDFEDGKDKIEIAGLTFADLVIVDDPNAGRLRIFTPDDYGTKIVVDYDHPILLNESDFAFTAPDMPYKNGDDHTARPVEVSDVTPKITDDAIHVPLDDHPPLPTGNPPVGDSSLLQVDGTDARDVLRGTDAAEIFFAGGGADKVFAGGGDDVIVSGAGDDFRLEGGNGADTFVFASHNNTNIIRDFEAGTDQIAFEGLTFADLSFAEDAATGRVRITTPDAFGTKVVVMSETPFDLTENDFQFFPLG